jgi:hypothetical protein
VDVYKKIILLQFFETFFFLVHICEERGTEPDHTVGLKLFALELRLDYMGTSVLMSRVSSLDVTLRDEWKINRTSSGDAFMPTRRLISLCDLFNVYTRSLQTTLTNPFL